MSVVQNSFNLFLIIRAIFFILFFFPLLKLLILGWSYFSRSLGLTLTTGKNKESVELEGMLQCLGYGPQTFNSASGFLVLGVFFRLVFLSALKTTLDSQRQYSNILVKYASVFEVSWASLHPASVIQVVVWCTLTVLCTNELAAVYFYSQYVITKDLHG